MEALQEAYATNPFVFNNLLINKMFPNESPKYVGIGDKNGVIAYAEETIHLWKVLKFFRESYK